MIETDADRLAMMTLFGELVTVAGAAIRAVFDAAYASPFEIASVSPVLTCREVDVAGVLAGAAVVVRGKNYVVRNVEPDGTGVALLVLERG